MATRVAALATAAFLLTLGALRFRGSNWTVARTETGQLSALDIHRHGLRYTSRAKGRRTAEVWGDDTMYVALCLAVKDEHFYISEWVAYHASIGVGRIYLYDDGSQPPLHEVLADFIRSGLVVYIRLDGPIKEGGRQQIEIYNDCIHRFGAPHKWLGMMDGDEFLIIKDGSPSLPAVLQRYEAFGGLAVNWRLFGSSGHATRPPGGILQSFTACTQGNYTENRHVKSIVRPGRVEHSQGPHDFKYREGFFAVNTNRTRVDGALSEPVQSDVLVLNHYIVRSREDFDQKIAKGNAMGPDSTKPAGYWEHIEKLMVENCTYAVEAGAKVMLQLAEAAKHAPAVASS